MTRSQFPEPLIISGVGRSGTSVLLRAVCRHRDVFTPSQPTEAPFLPAFMEFLSRYEDDPSNKGYRQSQYRGSAQKRREAVANLIAVSLLTDSDDDSIRQRDDTFRTYPIKASLSQTALEKMDEVFGSVKVVYIIRHGVEVVDSILNWGGYSNPSFEWACERWAGSAKRLAYLESRENSVVVHHDVLTRNPRDELGRIFRSFNMSQDEEPARYLASTKVNSSEHIQEIPYEERARSAWNAWSDEQREVFERSCGETMRRLDFPIPG